MNRRHWMAVAGGLATLLASLPLSTIFDSMTWLFYAIVAVGMVVGISIGCRALRTPAWLQVLIAGLALLVCLTLLFPSGGEIAALIPTADTFRHFGDLLVASGQQIRENAVPVPDLDGLLLLSTLGIGLVALLVDVFVVTMRLPALAGLPMLAIYAVPVAVLPDNVSLLWFGAGAVGFLWLLAADNIDRVRRFGRRFTGDGRAVEEWEPSPLSAAGRRLGVATIAVALVVPFFVPGVSTGLLDRFGTVGGGDGPGVGGPGAMVDLQAMLHDNLTRDSEFEMLRVRTTDPSPYYLRMATAEQANQSGFVTLAPGSGVEIGEGLPSFSPPGGFGVTAQSFTANVSITSLDMGFAPIYQQAVAVRDLDGEWIFDSDTHQLYSPSRSIDGESYTLDYVDVSYTPQALRTAGPVDQLTPARLTSVEPIEEISRLVEELTAEADTQYDRVRALYDYLTPANGFSYSLETVEGSSGQPIVDFLEMKKGYCVQYAASLAWLVRVAGYPARVAFGFTRGAATGDGYRLTNYNLHAWTEVFFPRFGWVPFDATPASSVAGAVRPAWAPDVTQATPSNSPTAAPSTQPSTNPSAAPTRDPRFDPGEALPNRPDRFDPSAVLWSALGVALVLLLLAPMVRRRQVRRRRRALTPQQPSGPVPGLVTSVDDYATARRDAHLAWDEALDTMVDLGVDVNPALSPHATAQFLGTLKLPAEALRGGEVLALAEERARYAVAPLRAENLDQSVAALRAGLVGRATRWRRVRAVLVPESVLVAWRLGWLGIVDRFINAGARMREAFATISPRRLLRRTP